jgi:hypothetical protein
VAAVVIVGAALIVLGIAVLSDPLGLLVLPALIFITVVLIVAWYGVRAALELLGDDRRA